MKKFQSHKPLLLKNMDIIQILLDKNILKEEQAVSLRSEIKSSGQKAEEVLLSKKVVEEGILFREKSEALRMPLKHVVIDEVPLKILGLIPEDSAKYYKMVPIASTGDNFEIGMVYPEDVRAQEALQFLGRQGNFSYRVSLITLSTFEELMKQSRSHKKEMKRALEELEEEMKDDKGERKAAEFHAERLVEDAPITKMVAVILRNAVEGGASDIHIEPMKDKVRVRFRFLGELHSSLFLPSKVRQSIVARIKILSNMKIDETRKPQDGRFSAPVNGKNIDFRVATFPTPLGEKVAIRVLDPGTGLKSFEDLGIDGVNLTRIKNATDKPFGLILVTGPTGSGKSTTLYAILRSLNKESVNIVSLEDPIEYFIEGVNQSQIMPEIGYDFAQGLRQVLRQDPDIVMVGEVRDKETATLVIHAALTGHIVLSTLHTNNAVGVIPRIVDMGVDRFLIPATLTLAIAQRLVRRLCDTCKEKITPNETTKELLLSEIEKFPESAKKYLEPRFGTKGKEFSVYEAKGCKKCGGGGYSGRIAIMEVMSMSESISDMILKESSEIELMRKAQEEGMITLRQDGMLKVLDGVTTIEEVLKVTAE